MDSKDKDYEDHRKKLQPLLKNFSSLPKPTNGGRRVGLSGERMPKRCPNNSVVNTKYNVLTFIPVVLWNQFKYFFNLYFLLIAIS